MLKLFFTLGCFAAIATFGDEPPCCLGGGKHRFAIRHIESGGIGYENGYTTLETFFSSDPNWTVIPFLDAKGHVFDNGKWAANAGIGLRGIWGQRVYGINTYYDYRNTHRLNCNQIGVGLETLGKLFDFRINGYLPVGKKISKPYDIGFARFSGHSMFLSQNFQFAMKGADAEFGFHFGKSRNFDFYVATGPYYYIGPIGPNTWGGKARIAGMYKDVVTLEFSDSYDRTFHNKFQGQISLSFSFGPKSKVETKGSICSCKLADALTNRLVQPVGREEIIVVDKRREEAIAIDPATGLPYFFVFVDNTSSSNGTFESPYPTLALAQANSGPNNIIYVFPGNGTTTGMDAGIALQASQKFWGSGVSHPLQTTQGTVTIPSQSSTSPIITNTDIDTEGNAVTLATNNAISGFTITSALNDAIYGTDPQSLDVSSCTIETTTRYAIEASFPGDASISLTNNQFLNNTNGVILTLHGTSSVACSNNTFEGQTSVSSIPLEISANSNTFAAQIENNLFNSNKVGSVRVDLNDVVDADISLLNNTMTNNGIGFQGGGLGSSVVIIPMGTTDNCSIVLEGNTFSDNTPSEDTLRSLYVDTSGAITTLEVTASTNTMSNNGGSALVFGSACTTFTLNATNNTLINLNDNGIATAGGTPFQTANITINNNTITNIGGGQNGIDLAQGSSTLNFTAENNTIDGCAGSGIVCYSSEFTNMTVNITDNVISNCQNGGGGNAASGISLDTYLNLNASTVANNTFSGSANPGVAVAVGVFTTGDPTVCLTLTGNSSDTDPGYSLTNPGSGTFSLSPCDVDSVNTGTINRSGPITPVQSCPEAVTCP